MRVSGQRLQEPAWRRYGYLLLAGKALGVAFLLTAIFGVSSIIGANGYAEEVARRFLRDIEPPRHLRVEVTGSVSVLVGPRDSTPASLEAGLAQTSIEGRRARSHGRGTRSQ